MTKEKYFVVAARWNEDRKNQENYIAGEFQDFVNATIFKDAYNKYYSTDAFVATAYELVNKLNREA